MTIRLRSPHCAPDFSKSNIWPSFRFFDSNYPESEVEIDSSLLIDNVITTFNQIYENYIYKSIHKSKKPLSLIMSDFQFPIFKN